MEFSLSNLNITKNQNFLPPIFSPKNAKTKQALVNQSGVRIIKCGKSTSLVVELERELEEIEKEGSQWREMKKCKNGKKTTSVELLECLEKEAIMGDDEGREPTDYNRRAQIFDKSSKVFQALKELHQ